MALKYRPDADSSPVVSLYLSLLARGMWWEGGKRRRETSSLFSFPSPPAPAARVTRRRLGTSQVQTDLFAGEEGHAIFRRFQYLPDEMKYQKNCFKLWKNTKDIQKGENEAQVVRKEKIKTPFTSAKKIGTARQIFGTVLTILTHGTPNFRRVNVSVPNVMWHQCSKF